eukprot:2694796-Amphidinium_carterae.1
MIQKPTRNQTVRNVRLQRHPRLFAARCDKQDTATRIGVARIEEQRLLKASTQATQAECRSVASCAFFGTSCFKARKLKAGLAVEAHAFAAVEIPTVNMPRVCEAKNNEFLNKWLRICTSGEQALLVQLGANHA